MGKEAIAGAPSVATFKMVFETRDSLGKIINILTRDRVGEKCLPVCVSRQGGTVCVKERSFTGRRYEDTRRSFAPWSGNGPGSP